MVHGRYLQYGGEDTVFDSELALLRDRGHAVEAYVRDNRELSGQPKLRSAADALWSGTTTTQIRNAIARFKPDVMHVHNTFPVVSPSVYWAASSQGLPVVQTLHNYRMLCAQAMLFRNGKVCEDCVGHLPWRGVMRKCYRDSMSESAVLVGMLAVHRAMGTYRKKVTRYIALDEFCRGKFVEHGWPAARIAIKPNFVADPGIDITRARRGGLFVGRLSPEKGIRNLIEAIALARIESVGIVGSGPERESLVGLQGVRLSGFLSRTEVLQKMSEASWLVVPSIWYEPFGLVAAEAFACGTPVIASRIGALENLIEDGQTGLLVEPGNSRDLAEKMSWAQSHPAEMARMGANARRRYEDIYAPDANYARLMEIYLEAIDAEGFVSRQLSSTSS